MSLRYLLVVFKFVFFLTRTFCCSVTFNEIQCWSLEEGVVWSNQLEIKGFGGRWDFGIEIIGGKGYVMTR